MPGSGLSDALADWLKFRRGNLAANLPASQTYRFPDEFLWGAATASHQVEGMDVHSDWWRYERLDSKVMAFRTFPAFAQDYKSDHWRQFDADGNLRRFIQDEIGIVKIDASQDALDRLLAQRPVIAKTYLFGGHFFVITGKVGNSYLCHDPAVGRVRRSYAALGLRQVRDFPQLASRFALAPTPPPTDDSRGTSPQDQADTVCGSSTGATAGGRSQERHLLQRGF